MPHPSWAGHREISAMPSSSSDLWVLEMGLEAYWASVGLVPSLGPLPPDTLPQVDSAQGWTYAGRMPFVNRRALQRLKGCPFLLSPPGDWSCLGSSVDDSSFWGKCSLRYILVLGSLIPSLRHAEMEEQVFPIK